MEKIGQFTRSGRKRHSGRSLACRGAPTKKEKTSMSQVERFVTEGSEKADGMAKAGAMLDEGWDGRSKSRNYAAGKRGGVCSIAVCAQLPLPGRRMEGLRRAQTDAERKVDCCGQEKGGNKASDGVVCDSKQVSVHEMWMRQHVHEDARNMYRTEILGQEFCEDGANDMWVDMIW